MASAAALTEGGYNSRLSIPDAAIPGWHSGASFGLIAPVHRQNDRRHTVLASAILVGAVLLVYANSLSVPLLFDDVRTILENPSIAHLWPLGAVLTPPPDVFSAGRPLLNLTFAINYAIGGATPLGYHIGNVIIHALASLAVFGLLRRTFGLLQHPRATAIAASAAVVWAVHPVLTESVTYVSQRAESLMGLFALLTLYCFARSVESHRPAAWKALSVTACLAAMATKETAVALPIVLLAYDGFIVSGSMREAVRRHGKFHGALAATWLLLAFLMTSSQIGARDIGYNGGYTWHSYALTEAPIVVRYALLSVVGYPLAFDYGIDPPFRGAAVIASAAVAIAAVVGLIILGLRRRPALAFLGVWFLLFLAPTSSIVPVQAQPMAESRVYMASLAVVVLIVIALYHRLGRWTFVAVALVAGTYGTLTVARNRDYRSELSIWQDTVAKRDGNARAHNTLGALLAEERHDDAAATREYLKALSIRPNYDSAHYNLANVLRKNPATRTSAIEHYERALQANPAYADAHNNLAALLAEAPDNVAGAIAHYRKALELKPASAETHHNLATLLSASPETLPEAIAHYRAAVRLRPRFAEAHFGLANALATSPATAPEALVHYRRALEVKPAFVEASCNAAVLLAGMPGRQPEAIAEFERAVGIKPDLVEAQFNLAALLEAVPGREREAVRHYEIVTQLRPDLGVAKQRLQQLKRRL